jgi:hypothetical protein
MRTPIQWKTSARCRSLLQDLAASMAKDLAASSQRSKASSYTWTPIQMYAANLSHSPFHGAANRRPPRPATECRATSAASGKSVR